MTRTPIGTDDLEPCSLPRRSVDVQRHATRRRVEANVVVVARGANVHLIARPADDVDVAGVRRDGHRAVSSNANVVSMRDR